MHSILATIWPFNQKSAYYWLRHWSFDGIKHAYGVTLELWVCATRKRSCAGRELLNWQHSAVCTVKGMADASHCVF